VLNPAAYHLRWSRPDPPTVDSHRVTYAQLRSAAPYDPTSFRAFWKIQGMLQKPDDVYTDQHVVASTQAVLNEVRAVPSMVEPTRDQLLAALAMRDAGVQVNG
jgi:hypothetical protein